MDVDALIALETDKGGIQDDGQHPGHLRLAYSGLPF